MTASADTFKVSYVFFSRYNHKPLDCFYIERALKLLNQAGHELKDPTGQGRRCEGKTRQVTVIDSEINLWSSQLKAYLSSDTLITPSSLGMMTAVLTTSWNASILLSRHGFRACGCDWISDAMGRCCTNLRTRFWFRET